MGTLRELTSETNNVHLVLATGLAEMYVYDTVKERCKATLESVFEVETKNSVKNMLELVNMQPLLSDKWLFVINYSKLKSVCKQIKGIFKSSTAVFLVKVKNYKEFKEFKQLVPTCNDLYLPIMRRNDVMYLLNGYNLSEKVVSFVATSYAREPEKIFELKRKLDVGIEVKDQRTVVQLLGASTGSVANFVFLLLTDPPKSISGFKRVFKKRLQMAHDLANAYSISTLRNFTLATVKDILQIKTFYLQGVIFNMIRDLPEVYEEKGDKKVLVFDEKKLSRYSYCLERIENDIPYERILRLYLMLQESGRWYSSEDIVRFMYNYYGGVANAITSKL